MVLIYVSADLLISASTALKLARDLFQLKAEYVITFTLKSVMMINSSKFSNCTKLEYCAKCTEVFVPDL